MRRPGGAVTPGDEADDRLLASGALEELGGLLLGVPPISPIMMMPSVSGSARNSSRQSMKLVPLTGSPPMPMQVDWPRPAAVVWATAS